MKIVILDGYSVNPGDLSWHVLEGFGELIVYDRTKREQIVERAKDADIILLNKVILDTELLEKLPRLKLICLFATGYNNIDIGTAKKLGILVCNIPNYCSYAVAQSTFALILQITNKVSLHHEAVMKGEWSTKTDFSFWYGGLEELYNKTIGLIGFGNIAKRVAIIAKSFGMDVIVYTRSKKPGHNENNISFVTLDDVYRNSHFISLHIPANDQTIGLINSESISKMRKDAVIINTARGSLIVEDDLADALNIGRIAGAAVDVLSVEPPLENHVYMKAKNIIITPHIAWAAVKTRERLLGILAENITSFLDDKPQNVVN